MASADRLIEVFTGAEARPAGAERERFLAEACRDEPALRAQVLGLLQAHEGAGSFLAHTELVSPAALLTEKPGDRIGRYKLLQQIGEGGCGVVYMAEQEEPVRRRVALKVIKLGMDTKQVIARFEAERQALAMMDHPNITKVLDAGATETGRPYFVMELVRGIKITEFCDENKLATEERLELFIQVCQAVQHAHQKGVIHRDIKPSNVLVTVNGPGSPGVPKVIDFGIAKATQGRLTDRTVFTALEQFIGTPAYMSPEQAMLTALDVDTRSDIYSLGVLLYELLTGKTPFDQQELLAAGLDEMRRTIREKEPARPSTRLSTMLAGELTTTARHRHTEAVKLIHLLRGDLDWIVMKSLEKDRAHRYETANGLAMDIQRHLDCEPVVARPPSRLYRFRKSVQRNKLAFAAAGAIVAALVIALPVSTVMFFRAKTEAAKSRQTAQFLKDMLKGVGPSVALGHDTTMLREIVNKTAERIGTDLKGQPEAEIELRLTLGQVYLDLQEYVKAEQMGQETLRLAREHFGRENLAVADALGQIAGALTFRRMLEQSEKFARDAIVMQKKLRGEDSLEEAGALLTLSEALRVQWNWTHSPRSRLEEAEQAARHSLAIRRRRLGDSAEVASALHVLSLALRTESKIQEGDAAVRESLAMRQTVLGEDHPETAASWKRMGDVLATEKKWTEAESCYRKAVAIQKRIQGPGKQAQMWSLAGLSRVLQAQSKFDEAETCSREALAIALKETNDNNSDRPEFILGLARLLQAEGKLAEARALAEEATALCQRHTEWPAIKLEGALGLLKTLPTESVNALGQTNAAATPQPR